MNTKREIELVHEALSWRLAAQSCGLYRGDTDVSTPIKWKSAQMVAIQDILRNIDRLEKENKTLKHESKEKESQ